MLAASYAKFQNGLSKAIVSIIKPIETFSTGDQFVAVRCLYSNEVNNVKDSFLLCKASALFQQVTRVKKSRPHRPQEALTGPSAKCKFEWQSAQSQPKSSTCSYFGILVNY